MKIIKKIKDIRTEINKAKSKGKSVGFVPTMGALHAGHLSLIRACRKANDLVVVSIFINPIQFGPAEDLKKYPRDHKGDAALCAAAGVDVIFLPGQEEIYPRDFATYVFVEGPSDTLCGKPRPGHFRGVTTVVAKLINIVAPDKLYLGQKDAQQAIIIKKMARELNIPVEVKVMPTVRAKDGLAFSSRNAYLDRTQRSVAPALYRSLKLGKKLIGAGLKDTGLIIRMMKSQMAKNRPLKIDYVAIVDPRNLEPLKKIERPCLMAAAVHLGRTRLIDNMIIH